MLPSAHPNPKQGPGQVQDKTLTKDQSQASSPTPSWLSCAVGTSNSLEQNKARTTLPEKGPAQTHSFLEQMVHGFFLFCPPQPNLAETQADLEGKCTLGTVLSTRARPGPHAGAVEISPYH